MTRLLAALLALAAWCCYAASAHAGYVFTTFDVPMAAPPSATNTAPMGAGGINNSGAVVGFYVDASGVEHGFLRDRAGNFTTVDVPGSTNTDAAGINASGKIVGTYADATGTHGYLLSGTSLTTLNVLGSTSTVATGISNSGLITGMYQNRTGGFVLDPAGNLTTFQVPGVTNGDFFVTGVNNAGEVVGYDNGGNGGFLMDSKGFTTLGFAATGINNQGDIVGYISQHGTAVGVLLDANGNYTTFTVPGAGGFGTVPKGINDRGEISGDYATGNTVRGFIATPVPEPSSLALLCVGAASFLGYTWRRKVA
jgi:hypothetical protein